jgi:hypothetical protein
VPYRRLIQVLSTRGFAHIGEANSAIKTVNHGISGDYGRAFLPHQQTKCRSSPYRSEAIYISAEWLATVPSRSRAAVQ